jgi:hypothetical protein
MHPGQAGWDGVTVRLSFGLPVGLTGRDIKE